MIHKLQATIYLPPIMGRKIPPVDPKSTAPNSKGQDRGDETVKRTPESQSPSDQVSAMNLERWRCDRT